MMGAPLLCPSRKSYRFSSPSEGGYVAMATGENLRPSPGSPGWAVRAHASMCFARTHRLIAAACVRPSDA